MTITCYDSAGNLVNGLTQWDKNRTIKIGGLGLSSAPAVHFYHDCSPLARVVTATLSSGNVVATIPNEMLQFGTTLIISVYKTTGTEGQTICSLRMPVAPRAKPENYTA